MELAGQLDAEDWHGILDRFFGILTEGVHRFEGTINQYTGDGMMALFGAPIAHEDHAQRACYAAIILRDELRQFADRLRDERGLNFGVRLGINSGDVVVGKIGDDLRMDYTAQGQTVGIAQRIESLAEAGRVYVSEATANLVSGFFELRSVGHPNIRGVDGSVEVFELEGASAAVSRIEAAEVRGLTHFVGRDQEMQMLDVALARAEDGFGQVVGVVGDPGLGKSRLCLEFVKRCRANGLVVHEAHCPAHGRNVPYLPILALFRSFCGVTRQDSDAAAREKITNLMQRLDPDLGEALPVFFEFMGIGDPDTPPSTMDPDVRQRVLFDLIHRFTRARADSGETVVVMIDDLHWIDLGSDLYVARIVEAVESGRVLLLLNFRPEYTAPWTQKSHYQQLPLVPLNAAAVADLVRHLLGDDETLRPLMERLLTWTEGNPFFVEEVIQMLIETGAVERHGRRYRLVGDPKHLEVPPNVRALLAARIDRLDELSKRVLQRASVVGKGFEAPILQDIAGLDAVDLAAAFDTLKNNEFIHETALYPTRKYAFKHPLSHEVAYASQLNESRRETHAAVAMALEKHAEDRLDETAALLAHHWEEAGEALTAATWHRRAAEWVSRTDFVAATNHWDQVRGLVRKLPDDGEAAELSIAACMQLLSLGLRVGMDPDEAQRVLQEGQAIADASGNRHAHMNLSLAHGFTRCTTGDVATYLEVALESRRRLIETDDIRIQANVWSYLAHALWIAARFSEALQLTEEGLALFSRDGFSKGAGGGSLRGIFSLFRGICLNWTGWLRDGIEELGNCQRFAEDDGSRELVGYARFWGAEACYLADDAAGTLTSARQGDEISQELGDPANMIVFKHIAYGYAHLAAGRAADAAEQMREARREKRAALEWAGPVTQLLAEALLRLGDLSAAATAAAEAIALCRRSLRGNYEAIAHGVQARALLRRDGVAARAEVEAALDNAAQLIDRTGARTLAPFLLEWRAEFAAALGDEVTCEQLLRQAEQGYDEIGAPRHAQRLTVERKARSA